MIKNKFMALTLTVVLTAGMLTGCGSGDKAKDKDAYRQYGINCMKTAAMMMRSMLFRRHWTSRWAQ